MTVFEINQQDYNNLSDLDFLKLDYAVVKLAERKVTTSLNTGQMSYLVGVSGVVEDFTSEFPNATTRSDSIPSTNIWYISYLPNIPGNTWTKKLADFLTLVDEARQSNN